jgi:hypothetical protein
LSIPPSAGRIGHDDIADYEAAVNEHGVQSIPTVIFLATGRARVRLADLEQYRRAASEAT